VAVEIEKLKTYSIQNRKPARLTFLDNGELKVEIVDHCNDTNAPTFQQKRWSPVSDDLKVLAAMEAFDFHVKAAIDHVCFDPVFGVEEIKGRRVIVIVPVKDLSEKRLDRASYVILDGDSAKISIN